MDPNKLASSYSLRPHRQPKYHFYEGPPHANQQPKKTRQLSARHNRSKETQSIASTAQLAETAQLAKEQLSANENSIQEVASAPTEVKALIADPEISLGADRWESSEDMLRTLGGPNIEMPCFLQF